MTDILRMMQKINSFCHNNYVFKNYTERQKKRKLGIRVIFVLYFNQIRRRKKDKKENRNEKKNAGIKLGYF